MTAGIKTERKWLVSALTLESFAVKKIILQEQGYIAPPSGKRGFLRLRLEEDIDGKGAPRYLLTIKSADVLNEDPPDHEISKREFTILWPWTEGRRVKKRRQVIELDGRLYDYDTYIFASDPELYILESEFDDEEAAASFVLPEAFGKSRDVSNDPRYKANSIATNGRPLD
ncbi:MAG: hypothetical protein HZB70_02815 [Candidatus Berkelbacteria bacterium]|nr:MAG: hypothetical protein HZB70_02815 [Candidatus Berkelbacteria bacterium]QQG51763.1 MAG: hypothetical protein HY845_00180 [Candidatus Berkelbacteria bacterium]